MDLRTVAVDVHVASGEHRAAARRALRVQRVRLLESYSLLCERVQVWRRRQLEAVAREGLGA